MHGSGQQREEDEKNEANTSQENRGYQQGHQVGDQQNEQRGVHADISKYSQDADPERPNHGINNLQQQTDNGEPLQNGGLHDRDASVLEDPGHSQQLASTTSTALLQDSKDHVQKTQDIETAQIYPSSVSVAGSGLKSKNTITEGSIMERESDVDGNKKVFTDVPKQKEEHTEHTGFAEVGSFGCCP